MIGVQCQQVCIVVHCISVRQCTLICAWVSMWIALQWYWRYFVPSNYNLIPEPSLELKGKLENSRGAFYNCWQLTTELFGSAKRLCVLLSNSNLEKKEYTDRGIRLMKLDKRPNGFEKQAGQKCDPLLSWYTARPPLRGHVTVHSPPLWQFACVCTETEPGYCGESQAYACFLYFHSDFSLLLDQCELKVRWRKGRG